MKKWMIALLTLSLVLTACGREAEREGAAEPVMEEAAEAVQTEPVTVETPEPVPTGQPKKVSWSLDWSAEDSYILTKIAMAEAEGEDTEGKALVILVVLNRVWDDSFPDTIEEVVMQENQFSPVANGRLVIEMDAGDRADSVMQEIFTVLMKYADYNEEFMFHQEMLPEKSSGELQIPVFLKGGVRDGKANY